jgi:hypothetical protein
MNFPAFQSLFVKFRLEFTRSRERFRSWPAVVPAVDAVQCRQQGIEVGWLTHHAVSGSRQLQFQATHSARATS